MKDQINIFLIPLLEILSDPEYQKKIWLKKIGPEIDSYNECIGEFFELSEAFLPNKEMQEILGPKSYEILKNLSDQIKAFHHTLKGKDKQNIELILSSPKWHVIQNLSKDLYTILKYEKY